jgi:hypothetical protein
VSGTCITSPSLVGVCNCTGGYTGTYCEILPVIDQCVLNNQPCMNNGTCVNNMSNYTCNCTSMWTGYNCSIPSMLTLLFVCFLTIINMLLVGCSLLMTIPLIGQAATSNITNVQNGSIGENRSHICASGYQFLTYVYISLFLFIYDVLVAMQLSISISVYLMEVA